jgi:hypothetical protein
VLQPVDREDRDRHPEDARRLAAPARRQDPQLDGEQEDQHEPDPEVRQREAEDRARHDRAPDKRVRLQPGEHPERNPDEDREHEARQRELEGRRQALQDDVDGGRIVDERAPEIAVQRVPHEHAELPPQGLVKPEALGDGHPLDLVGVGARQDVDRVAYGVDRQEHHRRHHGHDEQRLAEPSDQVDEHPSPCAGAPPGRARTHTVDAIAQSITEEIRATTRNAQRRADENEKRARKAEHDEMRADAGGSTASATPPPCLRSRAPLT